MVATLIPAPTSHTDYAFDEWVIELRSRATIAFPGWTDFNKANIGNVQLELFGFTLDAMSYKQDQQLIETRVAWARLRNSMIALGKLVAFTLSGAEAASVDLEITIANGLARTRDLVIPAGTVITTEEADVEFVTIADATILAGLIQVEDVTSENAQPKSESFVATGEVSLRVPLASTPYLPLSAGVVIGVDTFEEVESFFESGPGDKHFVVEVNDRDRAELVFGDGTNGVIPTGAGATTYKIGGGSLGNVDANTLTRFRDGSQFSTDGGEQVQLTVRNPTGSGGGVDRMSVEEARAAIPAHVRTLGHRSVTNQDFVDNARKVRGVARAMLLTSDEDGNIDENTGELYIVPVGGGLPSTGLKNTVLAFIEDEYPPTLTFTLSVLDPTLRIISFVLTVYLTRGVSETEARTATETALEDFFALTLASGAVNSQIDFGYKIKTEVMDEGSPTGEVPWSDMFNAVRDAATPDGRRVFRKVDEDLFVPPDDVALADREFPVLGSIQLTNGDSGDVF